MRTPTTRKMLSGVAIVLATAMLGIVSPPRAHGASPAFVQARAAKVTKGKTNTLAFNNANTAGDLIAIYVVWNNPGAVTLSDSRQNTYSTATARVTWGSSGSAQVFYAKNIAGGANTVTATFNTSITSFGIIYMHEYSGLNKLNPLDVTASAIGSAPAMSSGSAATTNASDLLFGAGASSNTVTGAGTGFTTRSIAADNLTEDRVVTTTGSYAATAQQNGSSWVMQLVAFRSDTTSTDTTPPSAAVTAPAGGATVSGSVSVTASASDNVGVAGVQFLLDGNVLGAEDTASPYAVSWNTTGVANGTHALAARARDAAGNTTTSASVTVTVSNAVSTAPAAAYAFNEGAGATTADASGHSLTGTLVNGPTWGIGKYGSAVNLDGIDDYVDVANSASLRMTGSMTLSAWINSATFPTDDAAVVSARGSTSGYQLDATPDTGTRSIGFKLTNSSGADMIRYGATAMQLNTWYHLTGVYNAASQTMDVYLNGVLDNGALSGTVSSSQQPSTSNVNIGQRASGGFNFNGRIDDVRIYPRALTATEVRTDMNTPLGGSTDTSPPSVAITAPAVNAQVSDIVTVTADAADDVGVSGVQFYVDNVATGAEDTVAPYGLQWDTRATANGARTLTAVARDAAGNTRTSAGVVVNVANTNQFQNEVLATGFTLPTAMKFLPNDRLLIVELQGTIRVLPPPYTTPDPTPFLQLTNVGSAGVQQGIYDLVLDPDFANNHFYYIFYTLGSPNRDRLSRFTANATLTGTAAGSELVLYQDPEDANAEHHGGALNFGNDGKLYFTTGEHFNPSESQSLNNPRGKIHRINKDGTIPTDDPFYDGAGPHWDSIWAYGLRNPYRAYYDAPTGRLLVGDVGGNDPSTAKEELNIGAAGANYGWPNSEGPCSGQCTSPAYWYAHNGRDAAITAGFVYHGSQFPSSYQGSFFFADYTQNWIKRLTFDANGNVTGVFNFEPADGSVDGPYGDIVYLTQGPDGALYYLDLGYSDVGATFGVSKVRRIRYVQSNRAPIANASADRTAGPTPLAVNFSSAGSSDPEGQPLTYAWDFGDAATSTAANPSHTYANAGQFTVRLTVSDGVNSTISTPITIRAGSPPTATILSPADGIFFRANDVISYSGTGTDPDDGALPASAFTWNIDFLHDGHVHPGIPVTGVKSGTFTIPTTGHDFEGLTRYRITLTVTDSNGLTDTKSVIVWPTKVNLTFSTVPAGVTLYLDGIAKTTPFVYDTLVGFNHNIEARNQSAANLVYTFASWSDGGAQQHTIVVPSTDHSYTATYNVTSITVPTFVQVNSATPQNSQSIVGVPYTGVQSAGNLNVVAVGFNDATSTITSVTDSAGNTYQLAAPLKRGTGLSQAIYYAKNIKAAAAGANVVTVGFSGAVAFPDVRITEYAGIDLVNPLDVTTSAVGSSSTASSGNLTTTAGNELIFGAGTTAGLFTAAGAGFATRIITPIDGDIVVDRNVTSTGSYAASALLGGAAPWVMQAVGFRTAGQ